MSDQLISFDELTKAESIKIIQIFLNREHGFSLEQTLSQTENIPNLWQGYNTNERRIICEIFLSNNSNEDLFNKILSKCESNIVDYNPDVFVFVILREISNLYKDQLVSFLKRYKSNEIIFYDLRDIDNAIYKYPELVDLINISSTDLEKGNSLQYNIVNNNKEHNRTRNYFLAGSLWDDIDQASRFYENNIWENGYEDKFLDIIISVREGDIIFLKSTFQSDSISYLRIKAVGVVLKNPKNGIELYVNWGIKNIKIDVPNLGKYRRTFSRIPPNDTEFILKCIIQNTTESNKLYELLENNLSISNIFYGNKFIFKNNGSNKYNDIVYPGAPFILSGYTYKFQIKPKTKFWRFGFRFSETENIEFYHPENRYVYHNLKDLHFGAGEYSDSIWKYSNHLQLIQYNFGNSKPIIDLWDSYQEFETVECILQYKSESKVLEISYATKEYTNELYNKKFSLFLDDFRHFKIFAWADSINFEIECDFQINELENINSEIDNLNPFKVGNITFRLGDMFDYYAEYYSNSILLPASSKGTATESIIEKALELGLPKPPPNEVASVLLHKSHGGNKFNNIGYVYSVEGRTSNGNIISRTCENIINAFSEIELPNRQIHKISLPLLGTGFGGVDPLVVAFIYDDFFNRQNVNTLFLISIQDENIFRNIKTNMLGKYFELQKEELQKPQNILDLQKLLNINIDYSNFKLNGENEIISLELNKITTNDLDFLENFISLQSLILFNCKIGSIYYLLNLKWLSELSFFSTVINDIKAIENLNLALLTINSCETIDISFLTKLKKLKGLSLVNNGLSHLNFISEMKELRFLDLRNNKITDINALANLKKLDFLVLQNNLISNIDCISNLKKLIHLNISYNFIDDVQIILNLQNLKSLIANGNPFVGNDLILSENEDHLTLVIGELLKQNETNKIQLTLPAKILLLGNHGSGKSSLLHYITTKKIEKIKDSTHIINIEKYYKDHHAETPEAIFFDFGGQDYYHGIYNVFLTNDSVNLLLWNNLNDKNQIRTDTNGVSTRDFSKNYWLYQLVYQYSKNRSQKESEPVLLIQTHADENENQRNPFKGNCEEFTVINEFYVSLEWNAINSFKIYKSSLNYLEDVILFEIEKKKKILNVPDWYKKFYNYIINTTGESYTTIEEIEHYYGRRTEDRNFLKDDLDQFSKQGLILYYKNDNDLNMLAWLDPNSTIKYIHKHILSKEIILNGKGEISRNKFENSVIDEKIIRLLINQKVIFLDETFDRYIIPGYLPLFSEEEEINSLLTFNFIEPNFVLKFECFIPFGLINQLICHYGKNKNKKHFWRDQLIFTYNDCSILIHLDFTNLEISVFIKPKLDTINILNIQRSIFIDILNLYWGVAKVTIGKKDKTHAEFIFSNFHTEDFSGPFRSPKDLYISLDNKYFVHHQKLETTREKKIPAFKIEEKHDIGTIGSNSKKKLIRTIDQSDSKEFPSRLYRNFTNNAEIKSMKKIFISYSNKDIHFKNELEDHLNILDQFQLAKSWSCEEITPGLWDEQIQNELKSSDIVIFMLSINFMSSDYIVKEELFKVLQEIKHNKEKKVVCVLVRDFSWRLYEKLYSFIDLDTDLMKEDSDSKKVIEAIRILPTYQFVPYAIIGKNDDKYREIKAIEEWEYRNKAYMKVVDEVIKLL
jgi:internalin A